MTVLKLEFRSLLEKNVCLRRFFLFHYFISAIICLRYSFDTYLNQNVYFILLFLLRNKQANKGHIQQFDNICEVICRYNVVERNGSSGGSLSMLSSSRFLMCSAGFFRGPQNLNVDVIDMGLLNLSSPVLSAITFRYFKCTIFPSHAVFIMRNYNLLILIWLYSKCYAFNFLVLADQYIHVHV